MTLPVFKYHPDPILSGSIVESSGKCECCGQAQGYIYTGPVYTESELDDAICPWCIADGTAHHLFGATFVDEEGIADEVPAAAAEEIARRTPGFNAWQSEQWFACCGDAMAFQEPAGIDEIRARYPGLEYSALSYTIYDLGISGGAATRMVESLNRDKGPTAYIFQCLRCAAQKLYVDTH